MFKIVYSKSALKFLRKQDKPTQKRIVDAISKLPLSGDIKSSKKLTGIGFVLDISECYSMSTEL